MGKLAIELRDDPLGRGYADMTDAEAADDLMSEYRSVHINSLSGDQVFQATVAADWAGLNADQKSYWLSFCSRAAIDPWAQANERFVVNLFRAGSNTVVNLASLRVKTVSRAEEISLGEVRTGDVTRVRS